MSEVKVNKVSPRSGTTVTIGDSGDTINIVGTLQNNGAALSGDISSVVAGTGLSGGATSGVATLNIEAAQPTITSLGTLSSATISGDVTVDTSTLKVDSSNDRVGIGTASPSTILDIRSASPVISTVDTGDSNAVAQIDGNAGWLQLKADNNNTLSGTNITFSVDGSEKARLDANGKVQIGTTSEPQNFGTDRKSLTIKSSSSGNYAVLQLSGNASTNDQIHGIVNFYNDTTSVSRMDSIRASSASDAHLRFWTAPSGGGIAERMRITNAGRLGINDSSPDCILNIGANSGITNGDRIRIEDGTYKLDMGVGATSFIQTIGASDLKFNTNGSERMRITDAGRIGIGSSSPGTDDAVLIENGQSYLTIKDAQQMGIKLFGDDTNVIFSYDKTAGSLTGGITFGHADGTMDFKTGGNNTRMRITSTGSVGIGTTSPTLGKLQVNNSTSGISGFHVVNTAGQAAKIHSDTNNSGDLGMSVLTGLDAPSSSGDCKWIRLADGNDSGKAYIQFKSSSPNAEFAAISDERLKTNIQDTDVVGLDVISNLRLVKFDWNETATQDAGWSMTGHQKLGFIAQEVEQILPEFISEDTNGFKIMGDSGFVPYLIKAMQEQQTKIQELEARITQLENA